MHGNAIATAASVGWQQKRPARRDEDKSNESSLDKIIKRSAGERGSPVKKKGEPTTDVAGNCLENLFNLYWVYVISVLRSAIPLCCLFVFVNLKLAGEDVGWISRLSIPCENTDLFIYSNGLFWRWIRTHFFDTLLSRMKAQ